VNLYIHEFTKSLSTNIVTHLHIDSRISAPEIHSTRFCVGPTGSVQRDDKYKNSCLRRESNSGSPAHSHELRHLIARLPQKQKSRVAPCIIKHHYIKTFWLRRFSSIHS